MNDPGIVVWFTGLPSSGKTTLARRLRDRLRRSTVILDGDEVREIVGAGSYATSDRDTFYRVLGGLAAMLAEQGHVVLVAATASRRHHRDATRASVAHFIEVWVRASLAECERRDVKGLYARARSGAAPMLPGVGAPYEAPWAPDIVADGGFDDAALAKLERLVASSPIVRDKAG